MNEKLTDQKFNMFDFERVKLTSVRTHVNSWVNDLRYGQYQQTTGTLMGVILKGLSYGNQAYQGMGFCCLGVACIRLGEWRWHGGSFQVTGKNEDGHPDPLNGTLPYSMYRKLGLNDGEGTFYILNEDSDMEKTSLVILNDERHLTFPEIGDIIQLHLEAACNVADNRTGFLI